MFLGVFVYLPECLLLVCIRNCTKSNPYLDLSLWIFYVGRYHQKKEVITSFTKKNLNFRKLTVVTSTICEILLRTPNGQINGHEFNISLVEELYKL